MKRYALLILTLLLIAPMVSFVEPHSNLKDSNQQNKTISFNDLIISEDAWVNSLSSAADFNCAIQQIGAVLCWGQGGDGQLGTGLDAEESSPALTETLGFDRTATYISAGTDHVCAILDNGDVSCWGSNSYGQLGTGDTTNYNTPTLTDGFGVGRTAIAISSGGQHSCVILDNGSVSCWGYGDYGQLGDGMDELYRSSPSLISSLGIGRTAVAISAGNLHTCAILDNGSVSCWGATEQIGNGDWLDRNTPTLTNSFGIGRTAVAISAGYAHTCVIPDNGSVSCWGHGSSGRLGNGDMEDRMSPTLTETLGQGRTAVEISSGYSHTCAILDNGSVSCWGSGGYGKLGIGDLSRNDNPSPQLISSLGSGRNATSISAAIEHTCALLDNGEVTCWGNDNNGRLGHGLIDGENFEPPTKYSEKASMGTVSSTAVEGLPIRYAVRGSLFDDIDYSQVSFHVDTPVGLVFNIANHTITGTPSYTTQTEWNFTVINGSQQFTTTYTLQILADNDGDGIPNTLDTDDDGDGFGDPTDACPTQSGTSTMDQLGCPDDDNDGYSNNGDAFAKDSTQVSDLDQDGFGDNISGNLPDACPNTYGDSARGGILGCPDADGDRWADQIDIFDDDLSQWNDTDGDGYGDSLIGFQGDACPNTVGTSIEDRFGCIDTDNDGWSDDGDLFSNNPTQWADRDGDGYGDNQEENATMSDAFPADGTQWNDTDGDGHGDNPFGTQGDWFPEDPLRWQDSDQDGIADEDDAFPNEKSQTIDSDGDGYGDNANGSNPDAFPNDAEEWSDTDGDSIGNNADAFPFDPSQQTDSDGDGFGDNERGSGADKFPSDSTQWSDIDGDGYGDNAEGTNPDAFIADPTQWADADGDGYGDNPTGRLADAFTEDSTQWIDQDGDGLGDNQSGTNPDPYLFDFDNDGYNDSIDPLPKLASPGDLDNDGVLDVNDLFPDDSREWADNDGDGEGDNADTDDDNDGWADTDEIRLGTDPFGSADVPIDSFEIVIPGTAVGLGAWDLIGMFGGIPLFMWIGFGFVTRNGRTAKYEGLLREAQSRDELEDVARMWEYSLMLRMLGPHQGIRLERLRAELDDRFEAQNQTLSSIEPEQHDQTQMVEQAMQVEQKSLPSIEFTQPDITVEGNPDGKGYEWYTDGQETSWYRNEDSHSEWQRFEA
jgi:alpha-tubulin suppressor-like RCC1 family protein